MTYKEDGTSTPEQLLVRWNAAQTALDALNAERALICRMAKAVGLDVGWFKLGCIVWKPRTAPKATPLKSGVFERIVAFENARPVETKKTAWVYFAISPPSKTMKVGISVRPKERLKALEVPGVPLILWAQVKGTISDEAACHKYLDAHRIGGEWFHFNEETIAICEALFAAWDVTPNAIPDNIAPFSRTSRSGLAPVNYTVGRERP